VELYEDLTAEFRGRGSATLRDHRQWHDPALRADRRATRQSGAPTTRRALADPDAVYAHTRADRRSEDGPRERSTPAGDVRGSTGRHG
jgi:hypothetical protein